MLKTRHFILFVFTPMIWDLVDTPEEFSVAFLLFTFIHGMMWSISVMCVITHHARRDVNEWIDDNILPKRKEGQ